MKKKNIVIAACAAFMAALSMPVFADYDASVIQQVQQALNNAGFDCGTPDGVAGNKTTEAVRSYQEAKGMTVDGQISDDLLAWLGIETAEGTGNEEPAAAEEAGSEEPAAAEVPEDTAETNDADGDVIGSSKFDETMYEGTWYRIKKYSEEDNKMEDLPYEIYVPTEWITEGLEFIEMPEEFSKFELGCIILPDDMFSSEALEALGPDYLPTMAKALGIDTGLENADINGIDDVYYGGTYEEEHYVDDAGSVFPEYADMLIIPDDAGMCLIMGRYVGGFEPPKEGQVEKFMLITRNILSSLRIAGTEEEESE